MRQRLVEQNPWWKDSFDLSEMKEYEWQKRGVYERAKGILENTDLMLFIKGMRRLGKSTIMKQLIIALIEDRKYDRNRVVYYRFSLLDNDLKGLLEEVEKGSVLFLDEIQYLSLIHI